MNKYTHIFLYELFISCLYDEYLCRGLTATCYLARILISDRVKCILDISVSLDFSRSLNIQSSVWAQRSFKSTFPSKTGAVLGSKSF